MSHGEETCHRPISKSIKYTGQCTRSNKINGDFYEFPRKNPL